MPRLLIHCSLVLLACCGTALAEPQEAEVVKERYENGSVKVERAVTTDEEMNYINHGPWKMWDQAGHLVAEGEYRYGNRHGVWNRWHNRGDAKLFTQPAYSEFAPPFVSQAVFNNGRLDGRWIIVDANQKKICEIFYENGLRNGTARWYYADGNRRREIEFVDGVIDGRWIEWGRDAKIASNREFQEGRLLAPKTENYPGGRKKSEAMYLFAPLIEKTADEWYDAVLATYTSQGEDIKHGPFTTWHANGQVESQGQYENGLPVGRFTWWYANAQKQLEGEYEDGKQDGDWVWWHKNGQKSASGQYDEGHPVGKWAQWREDGRIVQASDYSDGPGNVSNTPTPALENALGDPRGTSRRQ